jgi:hypothetical protein
MEKEFIFTPGELVALILGICTAIVTIAGAVGVVAKVIEKARAPEKKQNERLDEIDKRLNEHDKIIEQFKEYFTNDDNRFKAIEKSNKITQTAILALLKHSLNGNDKESLIQAEKSLEEYLIEK